MKFKGYIFIVVMIFLFIGTAFIGIKYQRNIELKFTDSAPSEVFELSSEFLDNLMIGDIEEAKLMLVEELLNDSNSTDGLVDMTNAMESNGEYIDYDIVGYYFYVTNGIKTYELTYQLEFEEGYMLYYIGLTPRNDGISIYSANVSYLEDSLQNFNKFTFNNKSAANFIVLILAILSFGFSIYTAAKSFASNNRKKYLWAFISLCGVMSLSLIWTTGIWNFHFITIGFPTGSFGRSSAYGSYVVGLRLPIGAIIYYFVKHKDKDQLLVGEPEEVSGIDVTENISSVPE